MSKHNHNHWNKQNAEVTPTNDSALAVLEIPIVDIPEPVVEVKIEPGTIELSEPVRDTEGRQVIPNMQADENSKNLQPVVSEHDKWMSGMDSRISEIAAQKSKGNSKGFNLNVSKLISTVTSDYKMHCGTERAPSDVFIKINEAVNKFIESKRNIVHLGNVQSVRSAYAYTEKKGFFLKHTVIGHDELVIREKIVACLARVERTKVSLQREYASATSNPTRLTELKQAQLKWELTLQQLREELKAVEGVIQDSTKV